MSPGDMEQCLETSVVDTAGCGRRAGVLLNTSRCAGEFPWQRMTWAKESRACGPSGFPLLRPMVSKLRFLQGTGEPVPVPAGHRSARCCWPRKQVPPPHHRCAWCRRRPPGAVKGQLLAGCPSGPWALWAEPSRELSLPGGADKPVAGGARTCSVGRQLLHEPLTPVPTAPGVLHCGHRVWREAETLHENNKRCLPQKVLFFIL